MLVDGLGALLTAFMLGLVLPQFPGVFGAPVAVLYPLAVTGCVCACYSLGCALLVRRWREVHLAVIAGANLLYGFCVSMVIYLIHPPFWGVLYFILESAVIVALAAMEIKAAKQLTE